MIIGPLITLLVPAAAGIGLFAWRNLAREKILLATLGAVAGLIAFTTITYLIQLVVPLSPLLVWILLTATAIAAFFLWTTRSQASLEATWRFAAKLPTDKVALAVFALSLLLSSLIAPKLLFINLERGISTGILNAYGDAPWHMANVTAFAEGQTTPPENPILADTRLTYPFLVNLLSAVMLASGGSYTEVMTIPALLLIPLTFTLVYGLAREATGGKKAAGTLAIVLFALAGGTLGWLRFGSDLAASDVSLAEFIFHLPTRDYTGAGGDEDGFFFLNPILSLLLPQRSFLLAFPAALTILLLLLPRAKTPQQLTSDLNRATITPAGQPFPEHFLWAGILAGLTPLVHGHTILALIPAILGLWLVASLTRPFAFKASLTPWLIFVLAALAVGLPEVLYYARGIGESESFLRFDPGWMAGETNWLWFWLKNTGLIFVAAIAGFFLPAPKAAKALAASGLTLFAAANLFLFAPWPWDNFKLLIYALLFSLPLIGWTLVHLFFRQKTAWLQVLGVTLIFIHILSAGLDLWKVALPTAPTWAEWDRQALDAAQMIRRTTPPGATILAAPIHNSPVALTGRFMYLGFPGHVWSHGGTPWIREAAMKQFFAGEITQLPEASVKYVLIGPVEKATYPNLIIQPTWQTIATSGPYQLYAIK